MGMGGLPPLWKPGGADEGLHHNATEGGFSATGLALLQRAEQRADRKQARLLVIDPSAAAFSSSEIDRAQVRQFIGALDAWAMKHDCTVMIITHSPKATGAAYSGSTDWRNAPRFMLTLKTKKPDKPKNDDSMPEGKPETFLAIEKANYALLGTRIKIETAPPKKKDGWSGWWQAVGEIAPEEAEDDDGEDERLAEAEAAKKAAAEEAAELRKFAATLPPAGTPFARGEMSPADLAEQFVAGNASPKHRKARLVAFEKAHAKAETTEDAIARFTKPTLAEEIDDWLA